MKYNITGRNLEITESIKTAVEEKITKLGRYFAPDVVAQVTMSMEKSRQKVEITIPVKGDVIRAESENTDMYVSIELAVQKIEVQLKKYRKKIVDRYQQPGVDFAAEYIETEDVHDDSEIKIVRRK
ncbi:MAG: ribosome-associated translation inhibitor RaiA, partial [Parasporobacterium sp.]|nr:ribosome-associated translation inhibitor RaiA [Parasporobacterium sp.]